MQPVAALIRLSAASAMLLAALPASADLVNIGGGDSTGFPYYRGFAATWIDTDTVDGGIPASDIFGQIFDSNSAPPFASAAQAFTRDGSTIAGRGIGSTRGFFASSNFAEIRVTNVNPAHQYYAVGGTGSKTSVTVFDPSALAQRAVFNWNVTGSSSLSPGVTGEAESRLDFGYSTDPDSNWFDLFSNPTALNATKWLGPGQYQSIVPLQLGQPLYLHFWSSAFTQIDPGEAPAGSNVTLTANFFSTFVLESVQLFDGDDNEVTDWTIFDDEFGDAVFDSSGRLAGITDAPDLPDVPQVPLPAGIWLLGTAVAATAGLRRRARSAG